MLIFFPWQKECDMLNAVCAQLREKKHEYKRRLLEALKENSEVGWI